MHYVDVYFMIMPETKVGTAGGAIGVFSSILCVAGMVSLLTGLVVGLAQQNKVVAVGDPRLAESIAFENI